MRYIVGIDEVGRGPLAGPVAVGAVLVPLDFDWSAMEGVRDSKKLSGKKREAIFEQASELTKSGRLRFAVATSSSAYIDSYGIVPAIRRALAEALAKIEADPNRCRVLLDGGLRAPEVYEIQETIIRGDASEPAISLASVMAKVTRDRMMMKISEKYPGYGFEVHKGYGTLAHRTSIRERGLCALHRATFCSRVLTDF